VIKLESPSFKRFGKNGLKQMIAALCVPVFACGVIECKVMKQYNKRLHFADNLSKKP